MQYTEFLDLVQQHAGLNSPACSATVTRATLRTFAERIHIEHIWAELPGEYPTLFEPTAISGRAESIRANRIDEAQA